MIPRFLLAASLGAAVALSVAPARADEPVPRPPPADPFVPRAAGTRLALETEIWPSQDFIVATMEFRGQISLHPNFALDIDIPWTLGGLKSGLGSSSKTSAAFGNITLGGHCVFMATPDVALTGGLTGTIPTRVGLTSASFEAGLLQALAAGARGLVDVHRLAPSTVFVRVPLGVEVRLAPFLYYRGEVTPVIWARVGEGTPKDVQLTLEHADELEARAPFGLMGGLRFQAVFAVSNFGSGSGAAGGAFGQGDRAQTAIEPFVGYEPRGTGLFARLGLLVAMDKPLGFGFDKDNLAAIRTQVGGKF